MMTKTDFGRTTCRTVRPKVFVFSVVAAVLTLLGRPAGAAVPTVDFQTETATAREAGLVPASLTVTRSEAGGDLEVRYRVEAKTVFAVTRPFEPFDFPLDGKDFEPLSGRLTFRSGERSARIVLRPLPNYHFKSLRRDRTIRITLAGGAGYTVGPAATAAVVIQDDPSPKRLPSDALFFNAFDYSRPGLAAVKTAVDRGDYGAARAALAEYYRRRTKPTRSYTAGARHDDVVQNALNNTYSVSGIKHHFDGNVDWSAAGVLDPVSGHFDPNWCWEFNRFAWWSALTDDYLRDPVANRAAGERVAYELKDWLASSPLELEANGLTPGTRWRGLEVAIRLEGSWLRAFLQLKGTSLFGDDLLVDWVKAFYLHARYLEVSAEVSTNRGAGEARSLFLAGVYFPEFLEAKDWLKLGLKRQEDILHSDVYPDGAFNELSPGYHDLTLPNFEPTLALAKENGLSVTPGFVDALMRMFDYMMYAQEPNRLLPSLNDSQTIYRPLNDRLKDALKLFPDRADYLWFTTEGKQGAAPAETSHLFPDAGQAVMRSGWSRQDSYLLMDAGPFGTGGHGNEDKLSINVDGYGVRHVMDCGPYDYVNTSPYRQYSVSTLGKSAPVIDGLSESRQGVRELEVRKSPVLWRTSPRFDYAAGYFGVDPLEGWGPDRSRPAETTRHIFYLKPDVWVVLDTFKALDARRHTYSAYFQCNDDDVEVDRTTRRVTIQLKTGEFDPTYRRDVTTDGPSMTITPLAAEGQTLEVLKGKDPPGVAGWKFEKSTAWKKQPIPTARYHVNAAGDVNLAYILAAAPAGKAPRVPTLETVPTGRGTYGLRVTADPGGEAVTLLVALDGKTLEWDGRSYDAPCLIVTRDGIFNWPKATG